MQENIPQTEGGVTAANTLVRPTAARVANTVQTTMEGGDNLIDPFMQYVDPGEAIPIEIDPIEATRTEPTDCMNTP